jgi:multidrug efflux system membrane fusion protein
VQQNVIEGQMVKAGDVLFKLDDQAVQATIARDQAQIAKDQANADVAKVSLVREQDLVKKGVDPQSSLDAAVAASKAADATVVVDQALLRADQVNLKYMTITAPIGGRIGTVNTSVGNIVHASDTSTGGLLTITAMDPVRVSFTVAESDLDSFRTALAGSQKLPVEVLAPGDTTPRATGTLSFIDSSVDTASGTVVVKADVDNAAGKLWPGQYVTAVTQLGAYNNATTVPLQAVQQSSSGPYVYAISAGEKVKRQPVTVRATVGQTAVISTGLKPGDHVVIEGQLRLNDGATVKETLQAAAPAVDATTTTDTTGTASTTGNS